MEGIASASVKAPHLINVYKMHTETMMQSWPLCMQYSSRFLVMSFMGGNLFEY